MDESDAGANSPDRMMALVYAELRRLAASYLRRERPDHTLQPTALVHEAFMRLLDQRQIDWSNRSVSSRCQRSVDIFLVGIL